MRGRGTNLEGVLGTIRNLVRWLVWQAGLQSDPPRSPAARIVVISTEEDHGEPRGSLHQASRLRQQVILVTGPRP